MISADRQKDQDIIRGLLSVIKTAFKRYSYYTIKDVETQG